MISPLLHVGYHKTGTSWLQSHLFTNERTGLATPFKEHADIYQHLVHPHALDFDPEACRAHFLRAIANLEDRGLTAVLSAERLCGDMLYGGYDSKELADRMASVFPRGKVLIVVR